MKKLIYSLLLGFAAVSCTKELTEDPKGLLASNTALNTLPGLQTAIVGAYKPLKDGYNSGFGSAALDAVVMGSDDLTTHPSSNKQELREMDQFAVNSTNSRIYVIWLGCYKAIQNANAIIDNYEKVGNTAEIKQIGGEAYFIRAYSYFWLTRLWGNVPIISSSTYTSSLLSVSKSDPATIYKLIESDLKNAETLMGNTKPAAGRVNAGAAKAVLAEVYLTEAGWPLKDASKYQLAAAKAKEVIDNSAKYGFDLVPNLATLWSGTTTSNNTVEDVFTLQFCSSCGNPSTLNGKSSMADPEESGWADYCAEVTFYNNFPDGIRKDLTFQSVFTKPNGTTVTWQNSTIRHPFFKKFRVNTPTPNFATSSTDQSVKLLRYAQVLLTYAEAQARSSAAPSTDAYAAVNRIRTRAGLPNLAAGLSSAAFADAVVQERAWELAGEYTRWFDLQRLQKVEQANANKAPDDLKPVGPIKYWLPIPYKDVQINTGL
ncbi:RagB/SusD family nutrient uptake outer membrane protein [Flavobacterium gilvum]|uniref:Carbohydrate-binding protein SusD n=1 Tax=Flavobacterium gilvum TaxID=1492737 RepID=A0AAC9I4T2_9FLAO|nr:RagB/SusD family nutrient uptake outer membrane protein [Flavobacterium gilvum]AOW10441.1 hypothetical protein EM308_13535 [Flavobacterium gilvum]KFC57726.1 hypothetical protein FEM08_34940 [Flavobacterium gilvum]